MMKPLVFFCLFSLCLGFPAWAFEIHGDYASISYEQDSTLESFNNRIFLGQLRYLMRGRRILTVEDEVAGKIDVISERVQEVLDMYPSRLHYEMSLYDTREQMDNRSLSLYGRTLKLPAFYAPASDTIFLYANTSNLKILAHEIGHVVVEKYFKVKPPVKIHELLAQFAEKHIGD